MGMILTEEQILLRDSAREFFKEKAPITALRKLRDDRDAHGYSKELWNDMVEMGWSGIVIPEDHGGLDFGFQGLTIVLEESGHTLTASPLISTVVLGAYTLVLGGSEDQKAALLPQIAAGDLTMTVAIDEGPHFNPAGIALEAKASDGGFVLNGQKTLVLDGHVADKIIVAARTTGSAGDKDGITLFLVDSDASGVTREKLVMLDSRSAAVVTLANVKVEAGSVVGDVDKGFCILEQVLDRAAIALAAEMLGSLAEVFDFTLEYLKERKQFGQVIGSFQSLQHRAAIMFSEIEMARSVVMEAASAVEEGSAQVSQLASLAKAFVNETANLVTREGVQMHGGIGMTDEHNVGLFIKRARVAEHTFGSVGYHHDRYATLNGY
jgi:alkylation response protein AidB-like acyl-CoA dehydrogenase